jgi:hypothetical protein
MRLDMPTELPISWSANYHPEWDETPEAYLQARIVAPTRSRRLGRYSDPQRGRKGYIGVYHQAGYQSGAGRTRFFLSLFVRQHTLGLRSHATMQDLLMALAAFHEQGEHTREK